LRSNAFLFFDKEMSGMDRARNVAVVAYENMDLLDLAGPFDVFAVASNRGRDFRVYTVAEKAGPVKTVSGITISPKYGFGDCPEPDILVVPGGLGARTEMHNEALTGWIRSAANGAELVLSVCTGALLLAKAGLLDGLRVTTNRRALELLREAAPPDAVIVEEARYVDNGKNRAVRRRYDRPRCGAPYRLPFVRDGAGSRSCLAAGVSLERGRGGRVGVNGA
jgi:transcriptional regulator GlxA family with amidase domain